MITGKGRINRHHALAAIAAITGAVTGIVAVTVVGVDRRRLLKRYVSGYIDGVADRR